ncbi:hypothetical protein QTO34_000192 [Cnephaeus nilssonii]|uniref:Ferritin n=1 Tax=Cnephaeus nilssonii TaxID=3371016 RepID=A0AA40IB50_CNENI|nr:hypothetical protein QTO34_000192 [Eptesicus nilssonii]
MIRAKYPNRVPVSVENVSGSQVADIDKRKCLVPSDITEAQFILDGNLVDPEADGDREKSQDAHCAADSPQPPTMKTGSTSQVLQNYHQNSEATINRYLSMSYYFDRDDVALKNFCQIFSSPPHGERERAEKLMKLQNRGGRIFLRDIKKPDRDDWETGLNAMECALHLGKSAELSLFSCDPTVPSSHLHQTI